MIPSVIIMRVIFVQIQKVCHVLVVRLRLIELPFSIACVRCAYGPIPSDFISLDRANKDLQNAFLGEFLAQKEAKISALKVLLNV